MPFTPYKNALDSEALQAAQVAFDLVWAEMAKTPHDPDTKLRESLAALIVELVIAKGERDPVRLKSYILEGSGRTPMSRSSTAQ